MGAGAAAVVHTAGPEGLPQSALRRT
jgi:hypothetical protein